MLLLLFKDFHYYYSLSFDLSGVVVDNTNVEKATRSKWISLAKNLNVQVDNFSAFEDYIFHFSCSFI